MKRNIVLIVIACLLLISSVFLVVSNKLAFAFSPPVMFGSQNINNIEELESFASKFYTGLQYAMYGKTTGDETGEEKFNSGKLSIYTIEKAKQHTSEMTLGNNKEINREINMELLFDNDRVLATVEADIFSNINAATIGDKGEKLYQSDCACLCINFQLFYCNNVSYIKLSNSHFDQNDFRSAFLDAISGTWLNCDEMNKFSSTIALFKQISEETDNKRYALSKYRDELLKYDVNKYPFISNMDNYIDVISELENDDFDIIISLSDLCKEIIDYMIDTANGYKQHYLSNIKIAPARLIKHNMLDPEYDYDTSASYYTKKYNIYQLLNTTYQPYVTVEFTPSQSVIFTYNNTESASQRVYTVMELANINVTRVVTTEKINNKPIAVALGIENGG